jgi:hypothetical protein
MKYAREKMRTSVRYITKHEPLADVQRMQHNLEYHSYKNQVWLHPLWVKDFINTV